MSVALVRRLLKAPAADSRKSDEVVVEVGEVQEDEAQEGVIVEALSGAPAWVPPVKMRNKCLTHFKFTPIIPLASNLNLRA